jgi:ABC-type glutathione transport system ATPase component
MEQSLLDIKDLCVEFRTRAGIVKVLRDVSFSINFGEMIGVVGESGSGKSVTAYSILGILGRNGRISKGKISFNGQELTDLPPEKLRKIRGRDISMIFQSPQTALNPIRRVGNQIEDVLIEHTGISRQEAREKAIEILDQVQIKLPKQRYYAYPFELSGGMCQRVLIAMALVCSPKMLIADEPTTGLDVTIQKTIMDTVADLNQSRNMSTMLITHDLGMASHYCNRIVVMRNGEIVETDKVPDLFYNPQQLYTKRLIAATPIKESRLEDLLVSPEGKDLELKAENLLELIEFAPTVMEELRDACKEEVSLYVRRGNRKFCIQRVASIHELSMVAALREMSPIHLGASGRVLMAYLSDEGRKRIIEQEGLERITPKTITNPKELEASLKEIRDRGYGISIEEKVPGSYAVAAPIFGADGQLAASLCIAGPLSRLSDEQQDLNIKSIISAARKLSLSLGFQRGVGENQSIEVVSNSGDDKPVEAKRNRQPLLELRQMVKEFKIGVKQGRLVQKATSLFKIRKSGNGNNLKDSSVDENIVKAVNNVSFKIESGESLGLVGESGSGKTTISRLACRLLDPTSGRIIFNGEDIAHLNPYAFVRTPLRKKIQIVFQDPNGSLNPRFTAFDCIADPLRRLGDINNSQELKEKVKQLANNAGLSNNLLSRFPHQLSGGQQARVGIARAIALDPELLILDEPTSALDVSVQAIILNLLDKLRNKLGLSYLFISHDLNVVRLLCNRILVMNNGIIVEEGPADQILNCPQHKYTQSLIEAVPHLEYGK